MERPLRFAGIGVGGFAFVFAGFLFWSYRPVPTFESPVYTPVPIATWPTEGWPRSTPEAQGMNSEPLLEMMEFRKAETTKIPAFYLDSITVIRNGHIVAEIYPNPNYPRCEMHVIHSAPKSIVSALVGIAIDRGLIESVDVHCRRCRCPWDLIQFLASA